MTDSRGLLHATSFHIDMTTHGMAFDKQIGSTGRASWWHAGVSYPTFLKQVECIGFEPGGPT